MYMYTHILHTYIHTYMHTRVNLLRSLSTKTRTPAEALKTGNLIKPHKNTYTALYQSQPKSF